MPTVSRYVYLDISYLSVFVPRVRHDASCRFRHTQARVGVAGQPLAELKLTMPSQVICEKIEKSDIATIDKKKYLVPADLTVGQFVYVIRKRIKLSPEKAIFIFVDEVLPPTAALMSSIYEEHKDEDGYVTCSVAYLLRTHANIGDSDSFTSSTRARTRSAASRLPKVKRLRATTSTRGPLQLREPLGVGWIRERTSDDAGISSVMCLL